MLKLPKITAGTYRHRGFVLPKIIIHGNYGVDKQAGNSVLLTESYVDIIGCNFEDEIGYEYFECQQNENAGLSRLSARSHPERSPHRYGYKKSA